MNIRRILLGATFFFIVLQVVIILYSYSVAKKIVFQHAKEGMNFFHISQHQIIIKFLTKLLFARATDD